MKQNLFDINGYVVVITGGTGVLGRTIAKYLAGQGAKVAILGRKEDVGNSIVEEITNAGGEASFYKTDVMNKETLSRTVPTSWHDMGRLTPCSTLPEET